MTEVGKTETEKKKKAKNNKIETAQSRRRCVSKGIREWDNFVLLLRSLS